MRNDSWKPKGGGKRTKSGYGQMCNLTFKIRKFVWECRVKK